MSKLPLENLRFGSNPSWLDSVRIGLDRGLWQMPESFIETCLAPILGSLLLIARHLFAICLVPVIWSFMHLTIVGAGLCGKITRKAEDDP